MRVVVAITGASGVVYGRRLLEVLREKGVEVHLIISRAGRLVVREELGLEPESLERLASRAYDPEDLMAPLTSGSFKVDAVVVVPASMKTVAAIASGYSDNLITRAADVALKEGRTLILVPRETPLSALHLENLLRLSRMGVVILPAMPAFYHKPEKIGDLVDFIVGKILDQLGVDHDLYKRWEGREAQPLRPRG
ncbi:aromatic acid decarboxylase [Candidatus Bathyarchaeota archaeon]|nr:MAG: UbiX family flavin prenyltransferase [Candidatus Bathyarchaeota archaeon]RLI30779.1 MAG: aromatic acid decarboxylase [Candidatus Bathyarchaeota archaeon]